MHFRRCVHASDIPTHLIRFKRRGRCKKYLTGQNDHSKQKFGGQMSNIGGH